MADTDPRTEIVRSQLDNERERGETAAAGLCTAPLMDGTDSPCRALAEGEAFTVNGQWEPHCARHLRTYADSSSNRVRFGLSPVTAMADQTLPWEITVEVIPKRYQAECKLCGWHTRQFSGAGAVAEDKAQREAERLALLHMAACPNPRYRTGSVAACGCWTYGVVAGESVGVKLTCPVHGSTTAVEMNVNEPVPWGKGPWIEGDSNGE